MPLDGSAESEAALPTAVGLARGAGARLILFHATGGAVALVEPSRDALTYLAEVGDRVRASGLDDVDTLLWRGLPSYAIVAAARQHGIDLLVMATHARGLRRLVLGSVAESVLRDATVPVAVIRAREPARGESPIPEAEPLRRVLVAIDGSPASESILPFVESLAHQFDLAVVLLQVVAKPRGRIEVEATPYLDALAARLRANGVRVRAEARIGDAAAAIAVAAREGGVDMIVMASPGQRGRRRPLSRSVVAAVLHAASVPIVFLKPARVSSMTLAE
ncbi:MAG TPA: universal stress protein [Methylomirabilota bacterium]|nr:universal stress protein [Methylomirabilota bacterium]